MLKMKRPEPIYTERGDASVREGEVDDRGGMQGPPWRWPRCPPEESFLSLVRAAPLSGVPEEGPSFHQPR